MCKVNGLGAGVIPTNKYQISEITLINEFYFFLQGVRLYG